MWDQVARQPIDQHRTQFGRRRRVHPARHVRREPRTIGMAASRHVGAAYPFVGVEHRGDLTRLNAETAYLQLVVTSSEELQTAVGHPAHHISGPVHPAAAAVGIGDEPCGGLSRASEVAAGQLVARQVQLAGGAVRHRPQPGVHDIGAGGPGRTPNGWAHVLADGGDNGLDRGLGGPVAVEGDHGRSRTFLLDRLPHGDAQRFAAERENCQWHPVQQSRVVQLGEHRRRGVDHVQTEPVDRFDQRLGVTLAVVVDDVHRVAVEQRRQRLPRRVESERPGMCDTQRSSDSRGSRPKNALDVVVGVRRKRSVGADDALRCAGGARGEDSVGRMLRWHRAAR